ncbi:MAG: hypothetical protein ABSE06_07845 [Anaerolineaceae bacterium]|jgi:hypothetical protein
MAKKKKRNVPQRARIPAAPSGSSKDSARPAAEPLPVSARPTAGGLRPSSAVDFNPDYTYAKQDLKRVGVLAASFIGALIVLSFVLPLFVK